VKIAKIAKIALVIQKLPPTQYSSITQEDKPSVPVNKNSSYNAFTVGKATTALPLSATVPAITLCRKVTIPG
jgi:hypothetical protein